MDSSPQFPSNTPLVHKILRHATNTMVSKTLVSFLALASVALALPQKKATCSNGRTASNAAVRHIGLKMEYACSFT